MSGSFGNISVSRMLRLNAQAGNGGEMPDDLTEDEQKVWNQAVRFHERAQRHGLTVALPHEMA